MNAKKSRQKLKIAMPKRGSLDAREMKRARKVAQNLRRLKQLEENRIILAPVAFRLNTERLPGESLSKYQKEMKDRKTVIKDRCRGLYLTGSMAGKPVPKPVIYHKLSNASFRKKNRRQSASKGKFLSGVHESLKAVRKAIQGNSDK